MCISGQDTRLASGSGDALRRLPRKQAPAISESSAEVNVRVEMLYDIIPGCERRLWRDRLNFEDHQFPAWTCVATVHVGGCFRPQECEMGDFTFPYFYNYPPYFTLQPVKDTREKQIQLWKELILKYCKHQKCFLIDLDEEFPLFENSSIQS